MKDIQKFDIISICSLILTLILFVLFERSRNIIYVPIGIITFTVFAYWLTNRITFLARYSEMIFPFIVGMLIFMLFIEDFGEFYNPFYDFNELLLSSSLADFQIFLATNISVTIINWFWLINLIVFCSLLIYIYKVYEQKTILRYLKISNADSVKKEIKLNLFLNIVIIFSIIGIIITVFGFLFEGIGYPFRFTFIDNIGRIHFPANSSYPSTVLLDAECSGIHSFVIFISCFYLTFLYIGRKSKPKKLLVTLLIGTIGTLIGNWLRVVAVLLTGYYLGNEPMMFVHEYAGLIIFLGFMLIFWSISLDYLLEEKKIENKIIIEEN